MLVHPILRITEEGKFVLTFAFKLQLQVEIFEISKENAFGNGTKSNKDFLFAKLSKPFNDQSCRIIPIKEFKLVEEESCLNIKTFLKYNIWFI